MAHPIFDSLTYPWNREEAVTFHTLLSQAVNNSGDIELLYLTSAAEGIVLPGLTKPQAPHLLWKEALQNLAAAGVLRRLVDKVSSRYRQNNEVQAAVRALINAQSATRMHIFTGKETKQPELLVLDRGVLGGHLERLEAGEGPLRTILVRGAPGSGKSHGRYRFFRAAGEHKAKTVYLFSPLVTTVQEVIAELFSALNASAEIPPNFTTDAAYYKQVCRKLKEVASGREEKLWIAIDDLGVDADGVPLLDPEIRKFCDLFVLYTMNPEFGKWFRLMLIDYPSGPVPTWWLDECWAEDVTSADDIQAAHVVEVMQLWLAMNGRDFIAAELDQLARQIIARADGEQAAARPLRRLRRIHTELVAALRELTGAAA